jgi:hypothetical protein
MPKRSCSNRHPDDRRLENRGWWARCPLQERRPGAEAGRHGFCARCPTPRREPHVDDLDSSGRDEEVWTVFIDACQAPYVLSARGAQTQPVTAQRGARRPSEGVDAV